MIETLEGLKNVDEIAAVPGVGAIFLVREVICTNISACRKIRPKWNRPVRRFWQPARPTTSRAESRRSPRLM